MATREFEEYETCPYNSSHRILRSRFQVHLTRCKKSYPDKKLSVCPFNSTHLLEESQLNYHVTVCADRASLDKYKYNIDTGATSNPNILPPVKQEKVDCDESWDDVNVKTYDPQKYASEAKILRNISGALPSERKAFRNAERMRLNRDYN